MSKLRIGIIGTGQRVCFHGGCTFKECKDLIEITALCDIKPERVEYAKKMYAQEFGYDSATYTDYRKMLDSEKLDGVYVSGPNDTHLEMTLACFDKGVHVLCEKPMEISLERCDRMIAAAKKKKLVLSMGMQMHYRERYHIVKRLINEGRVGKPAMVWCTEYRHPFVGMKDWVWDTSRSGGAIVEKNCHHYEIFDLWLNSLPTTVYATGNQMKHFNATGGGKSDIIDNAWVVNDYECGARGMVGICFLATNDNRHYREFGLHGTEGKITFSSADGEKIHWEHISGDTAEFVSNRDLEGGLFRDFCECVRTGRQPLVTGELARRSLLVPLAAEKSLVEKRVVNVDELK
jgi:predicted dehydrogenase